MDNASINDVLARTLGPILMECYGIPFNATNGQIWCLAHIVNLVVQKILSALGEAKDPDEDDYYLLYKFLSFHYRPDVDEDLKKLEKEETVKADDMAAAENLVEGQIDEPVEGELMAVQKLCIFLAKEHYSSQYAQDGGRELKHVLLLKKAINGWVAAREKLEALTLTPSDWNLLQQLCEIIGAFTVVTRHMFLADTPTLPWVLPMYHHMQGTLERAIEMTTLPSLKHATTAGLSKLNIYYVKVLDCQHNVVATGEFVNFPGQPAAWPEIQESPTL
ncbi:uncharacterized protein LAESUDRAFT_760793 [Laetiporus sulphureus 93-53]|uniref:Uncharacterized protein n=1 Tax=Laetiporus sulphureus 93-53 TaxID=1314785 RepID=A0A165DF67_9APHY|nr:uncharacterized protein LAESUDRAFT_760793 [Laetiporus sulphureus 93-53]KZT04760.1 hypothetical protein LAESUDRAFT_760793 [Laetiporus sulphureus 93-53]